MVHTAGGPTGPCTRTATAAHGAASGRPQGHFDSSARCSTTSYQRAGLDTAMRLVDSHWRDNSIRRRGDRPGPQWLIEDEGLAFLAFGKIRSGGSGAAEGRGVIIMALRR